MITFGGRDCDYTMDLRKRERLQLHICLDYTMKKQDICSRNPSNSGCQIRAVFRFQNKKCTCIPVETKCLPLTIFNGISFITTLQISMNVIVPHAKTKQPAWIKSINFNVHVHQDTTEPFVKMVR